MIKRTLAARLKEAATQFPVITVTGPRQSGKTTLVQAVFKAYDHLAYWRKVSGDDSAPAALIYGGDRAFTRSAVHVYPWFVL